MIKHICDICETNGASNRYKVKSYIDDCTWEEIDVCDRCMEQIINKSKSTKLKPKICPYYVENKYFNSNEIKSVCYGTKDAEECSCKGQVCNCTHFPEKKKED